MSDKFFTYTECQLLSYLSKFTSPISETSIKECGLPSTLFWMTLSNLIRSGDIVITKREVSERESRYDNDTRHLLYECSPEHKEKRIYKFRPIESKGNDVD